MTKTKAMLSGVLDSPYGEFTIHDPSSVNDRELRKKRYYNGHRVESQKLVGEDWEHTVPSHWIKPDNVEVSGNPVPMVLHCPKCGVQHIDAPEPENGWDNPPHKSHLCHGCGTIWRPADVPTAGVASVSRGSRDTWPPRG